MSVDRELSGMVVTCEGYRAVCVKLIEVAAIETGRCENDLFHLLPPEERASTYQT